MSSERFQKITEKSDKVWLVGDIHGQYDLLMEQLAKHAFDPRQGHILVSVGDLVDRGPDSFKTLRLLNESWFFATMGNHEQMLLRGVAALKGDGPYLDVVNWQGFNGGEWYGPDKKMQSALSVLLPKVAKLPLAIEIETEMGRLGVVHAAVPDNHWLDTEALNQQLVEKHLLWYRGNGLKLLNAQHLFSQKDFKVREHQVSGIDRVVVGHTIMNEGKPVFAGNTLYLDVGAAKGIAPAVIRADAVFNLSENAVLR